MLPVLCLCQETADDYLNSAKTNIKLGKYLEAIEDYSSAISIKPNLSDTYFNRARAYVLLEEYNLSINDFSKFIDLKKTNSELRSKISQELGYSQRGLMKSIIKDNIGAIEDYSKAIELNPKNADNYFGRGNVYRETKSYKMAIDDFSNAIKYDAGYGDLEFTFFNRAMVKKEIGEDFCQDLKKSCELGNSSACNYSKESCNPKAR